MISAGSLYFCMQITLDILSKRWLTGAFSQNSLGGAPSHSARSRAMGSAQKIKRTSRRMRKVAAIKEKNRQRHLMLVATNKGVVDDSTSVGPESGETLRLPVVTSQTLLQELDDDAPILPAIRAKEEDEEVGPEIVEVPSEVLESRDALLAALRAFLYDAHDHDDAFYATAFEFEGRLLAALRTPSDRAPSPVDGSDRPRERKEALDRQAAWENEFLAELEDILLYAVNHSIAIGHDARNAGHPAHRFANALSTTPYVAKSQNVLQGFTLGAVAMRGVHARLAGRTPSQYGVPRFMLYNVRHDGAERIVDGPSAVGIAVWTRMRQRLLRGQSRLARRLQKRFGT